MRLGLLPGGDGFLVQRIDRSELGLSRIYAVSFEGDAVPVVPDVAAMADAFLTATLVEGWWAACGSARRIGPRCELYCRGSGDGGWLRVPLDGGDPEPVACPGLGEFSRIMDVWQR